MSRLETGRAARADSTVVEHDSGAERREHRRVEEPAVGADERTTVHNVSLGGICMSLETPVRQGDRLSLRLRARSSADGQEMRAEVVWSRRGRVGLRWVEQTPDQFFWLCQSLGFWWGPGSRYTAAVSELPLGRD
jgi:hypothetical protein